MSLSVYNEGMESVVIDTVLGRVLNSNLITDRKCTWMMARVTW